MKGFILGGKYTQKPGDKDEQNKGQQTTGT